MKVERFLKEYASHKIKSINDNDEIFIEDKSMALIQINKILFLREKGILTVEESIKGIMNVIK